MQKRISVMKRLGYLFLVMIVAGCTDQKPNWVLVEKLYTTGMRPTGVAYLDGEWIVSSREENMLATLQRNGTLRSHNTQFVSPCRLMSRGPQLIVPEFENNRIATLVGTEIMYYPLLSIPDGVMAGDIGKGKVAVADYNGHRIIFYKNGKDLTFGSEGSDEGQFRYPTDVQFYGGHIYVADNQNHRIQKFDEAGQYVSSIGDAADIEQASGLFVWDEGILVCDKQKGRISLFNHEGQLVTAIEEGFERPSDAFAIANVIYVADEEGGYVGVLERR